MALMLISDFLPSDKAAQLELRIFVMKVKIEVVRSCCILWELISQHHLS